MIRVEHRGAVVYSIWDAVAVGIEIVDHTKRFIDSRFFIRAVFPESVWCGVDIVTPGAFVAVGKGIGVQRITNAIVVCIRIEGIEPSSNLIHIAQAIIVIVGIGSIGIAIAVNIAVTDIADAVDIEIQLIRVGHRRAVVNTV